MVLLLASPGLSQQGCPKVNDTLLREKRIEAFTVQVLSKLGYTGGKPPNPTKTVEYGDIDPEILKLYHQAEAMVNRHNSHCPLPGDPSNFGAKRVHSLSGSECNDTLSHVLLPHTPTPHLTSAHSSHLSHLPHLIPTSLPSLTPPHTSLPPPYHLPTPQYHLITTSPHLTTTSLPPSHTSLPPPYHLPTPQYHLTTTSPHLTTTSPHLTTTSLPPSHTSIPPHYHLPTPHYHLTTTSHTIPRCISPYLT